ncbi:DUF1934 family protein [Iocasia frigidifontis]|uniref:DUF1934 family protein n=1 Tax=Iocasia fonsfrigidae TaxID=2682810 RepID=A0A8A7KBB9_9FIRM|nr:DUF1934 domain-containing protein [Iocasia fonsfrigidae]QTL96838.1 DUF1934 family protein [Iocasia fonsfrigidae]
MSRKIELTIKSCQKYPDDGRVEEINSSTEGLIYRKNRLHYLVYNDYSAGLSGVRTTIKIDQACERVLIIRAKPYEYQQTFVNGKKEKGSYQTNYGRIKTAVLTEELKIDLRDKKGSILIDYKLYFNGQYTSRNNLLINWV